MKKIFSIIAFLVSALIMTSSAYADCKVTVGWEPWEPYQFKNNSGTLSGVDIEIVQAAFEESGCKVEYKEMLWKSQLASIEDGTLDAAIGASLLHERKKYANFSQEYEDESYSIFFIKGGNEKYKISKIEDLVKYKIRIRILRGYFYGNKFQEAMKKPEFQSILEEADNDEENIKKLDAGKIQAFIIDPFAGTTLLKKMNMIEKVEKNPLTLVTGTIHAMFSKKSVNPDTVKAFNDGLKKIKKNGKLNQIVLKYLNLKGL